MKVEYFFDFSCPFAYLGATQIERVCARAGAEVLWRPMLLGGIFRSLGGGEGPSSSARAAHSLVDASRWAELHDVPLTHVAGHPYRTIRALRALLATDPRDWPALIAAIYETYWARGEDISEPAVLAGALGRAGLDEAARDRALAANDDPEIKEELRRRTSDALARGVFGAPTMFVDTGGGDPSMVFGQDRLPIVAALLAGWDPGSGQPPDDEARAAAESVLENAPAPRVEKPYPVEFWYDISSPYSYLAATQIEALCDRIGAPLTWRPMLLGAVFKTLAGPLVPILSAPDAKRQYLGRDLTLSAAYLGVPFHFSSHFPLRTVTALRLLDLAGEKKPALSRALFAKAWVENARVDEPAVLATALAEVGLDSGLLEKTSDPVVKQALFAATAEATERGIFGAPTFIVKQPAGDLLFWGHDRMDLVARAAAGWRPRHG